MKINASLFALALLPFIHGCGGGGGNSSAKLEVSRGMLVSNSSFDGGLIVVGRNESTKEFFSMDLATGTEAKIPLKKGDWSFYAIGWDGGASAPYKKFAGRPYCGLTKKSLIEDAETVDITVNETTCADTTFSRGHVDSTNPSIPTLKTLGLITTCNTFYPYPPSIVDAINSSYVTSADPDNFCDLQGVPGDLKSSIGSVKIYATKKSSEQITSNLGFSSECISASAPNSSIINPMGSGRPFFGRDLKLPYGVIPLKVVTFKDSTCSNPTAQFDFDQGLSHDHSAIFDHRLFIRNGTPNQLRLILPANKMKRATSPLMAHMPSIVCDNSGVVGKCVNLDSAFNYNFHGFYGAVGTSVFVKDKTTCSSLAWTGTIDSASCVVEDGMAKVTFFADATPGAGGATFTLNGTTYSVYISEPSVAGHDRFLMRKKHEEWLGFSPNNGDPHSFFQKSMHEFDEIQSAGIFSNVRDIFSGEISGLFNISSSIDSSYTFEDACNDLVGSKTIEIYDDETLELFNAKLVVHNSPVSSGNRFICDISTDAAATCNAPNNFHKRLLAYDYRTSAIIPRFVVEFSCTKLLGKYGSYEVAIDSGEKRIRQESLSWNTEPSTSHADQKFDHLKVDRHYVYSGGAWDQRSEDRSMTRFMKDNSTGDGMRFKAWNFTFNTYFDGTDWEQKADRFQMKTGVASLANQVTRSQICFHTDTNSTNHVSNKYSIFVPASGTMVLTPSTSAPSNSYYLANVIGDPAQSSADCGSFGSAPTMPIEETVPMTIQSLSSNAFNNIFTSSFFTDP